MYFRRSIGCRLTFLALLLLPLVPMDVHAADALPNFKPISFATGNNFTCALNSAGAIKCWGGTTSINYSKQAPFAAGSDKFVSMTAGKDHACALTAQKKVYCWGMNNYGQLGVGKSYTYNGLPLYVSALNNSVSAIDVVAIQAGENHTCALTAQKKVYCWGMGINGQLGNGGELGSLTFSPLPVEVKYLIGPRELAMDGITSCAFSAEDKVACWGNIFEFDKTSSNTSLPTIIAFPDGTPLQLSYDNSHTAMCAVLPNHQVKCIFDGKTSLLSGITNADYVTIRATPFSNKFLCVLLNNGKVACAGDNEFGQLGTETLSSNISNPTINPNLQNVTALRCSQTHCCTAINNQTLQCWGQNKEGQLGPAAPATKIYGVPASATPVAIPDAVMFQNCLNGQNYDPTQKACVSPTTPSAPAPLAPTPEPSKPLNPPATKKIAAGKNFTCVITDSATKCLGDNTVGQLGNGQKTSQPVYAPVTVNVTAKGTPLAIAANTEHACLVAQDGYLQCWGNNKFGQLGNGSQTDSATPVHVYNTGKIARVALGASHSCAIELGGNLLCWGNNDFGQLGTGTPNPMFDPLRMQPVQVVGMTHVKDVALGARHSCALDAEGQVYCWGANQPDPTIQTTPTPVKGLGPAKAIAAGADYTCAAMVDGSVSCWGAGESGQLGSGNTNNSVLPLKVLNLNSVTAIAAGGSTTCVLLDSGHVKCWGRNSTGELGNGSTTNSPTPVDIASDLTVKDVVVGNRHACVLQVDDKLLCWGSDTRGELGFAPDDPKVKIAGTESYLPQPTLVASITPPTPATPEFEVATIAAGADFTCAIYNGAVMCFGDNEYGQLGQGKPISRITNSSFTPLPVKLNATDTPKSLAAGRYHACTLLQDGTMRCWGAGASGQLGDGGNSNQLLPVSPISMSAVAAIAAGGYGETCAIRNDKTVWCWGSGVSGELGNDTQVASAQPVLVKGLSQASSVSVGSGYACAVDQSTVWCWGINNFGQLGVPSIKLSKVPVQVPNVSAIRTVALGMYHSCALSKKGDVLCWGKNDYGQLGDGSSVASSATPVAVQDLHNVTSIAAGQNHTCATLKNGDVYCWGANFSKQSGATSGNVSKVPVKVGNFGLVSAITAGGAHTCMVAGGGSIQCWGDGKSGQLGVNLSQSNVRSIIPTTTSTATPTPIVGAEAKLPSDWKTTLDKMLAVHKQLADVIPKVAEAQKAWEDKVNPMLESILEEILKPGYTPDKMLAVHKQLADVIPKVAEAQKAWEDKVNPMLESILGKILKPGYTPDNTGTPPDMGSLGELLKQRNQLLGDLNTLYSSLFPNDAGAANIPPDVRAAYLRASAIYLSALFNSLINGPQSSDATGCTVDAVKNEHLLNYLMAYQDNPKSAGEWSREFAKRAQCLTVPELAREGRSLYGAYDLVMTFLQQHRPAVLESMDNALGTMLAPILFPLVERTRATYPADPSIELLVHHVAVLNKVGTKIDKYGTSLEPPAATLCMYNPNLKDVQCLLTFCTSGQPISDTLPKPNGDAYPKTMLGVSQSQVEESSCGATPKQWSVWVGGETIETGCLIYKNYANMAVHPVVLGNGSCRDWDTLRKGKGCCEIKGKETTSTALDRFLYSLSNLILSSAEAQTRTAPATTTPSPQRTTGVSVDAPVVRSTPVAEVPKDINAPPKDPYAIPTDPDATTIAVSICPPERCYEDGTDLIYKIVGGPEIRYANMTRDQWIALQKSHLTMLKGKDDAHRIGSENYRNYLTEHAPLIIRGAPISQKSELTGDNKMRTTWVIDVHEVLRGSYEHPTLTLVTPGGCVDNDQRCEFVFNYRPPAIAHEAIFLLEQHDGKTWDLLDLQEGSNRLENDRLLEWNLDLGIFRSRMTAPPPTPGGVR